MLKKNAESLHQSTVDTAKASERGIVDIETLQHTNQELISALDEIIQIQEDGKVARAEAEKELARIEQELKEIGRAHCLNSSHRCTSRMPSSA